MGSSHLLWDCSAARLASTDGGYWPNRSWAWQIRSSYGRSWGMQDRRWWTIAMSHSVCFTSFSLCSTIWGGEGGLKVWNTSGWAVGLPWEQTLILILHAVLSVASVILVRQDECSALKQADEELIPPPNPTPPWYALCSALEETWTTFCFVVSCTSNRTLLRPSPYIRTHAAAANKQHAHPNPHTDKDVFTP